MIEAAGADLGQPATINGAFGGNAQQFEASTKSMPMLFVAAIIVIYIVLGVLYESFAHPITILSGCRRPASAQWRSCGCSTSRSMSSASSALCC